VRVANAGSAASSGRVSLQLSAPQGASTSGAGWDCADSECTSASAVAAGESLPELEVAVPVPAVDTPSSLAVSVSLSNPSDARTGNNQASVSTGAVAGPVDLVASVTDGGAPLVAGGTGRWRVRVANAGSAASSGRVSLQLSVPDGTSLSGVGWDCADRECTSGSAVPAGGWLPDLEVAVPVSAVDTPSSLAVSVGLSNASDAATGNNSASASTGAVAGPVDLVASVTDGGAPLVAGTTGRWTVRVANAGSAASSGRVTVQLSLPEGASLSGAGWDCADSECTTAAAVAAGGSLPELAVAVPVPAVDTPSSLAVSVSLSNPSDGQTSNNHVHHRESLVVRAGTDLIADITPLDAPFHLGGQGRFQIVVRNFGGTTTSAPVTVNLWASNYLLPQNSSGDGWSCDGATRCSHSGGLAGGAALPPLVLTVAVDADAPTKVAASVTVSSPGDSDTTNNTRFAAVTTEGHIDLIPSLTPSSRPFVSGQTASYEVVVRNTGVLPSSGPVTVRLDAWRVLSGSGDGWTCSEVSARCTTSAVVPPDGALPRLTFSGALPASWGAGTTNASVSVSNHSDGVTGNDSAWVSVPVVRGSGPDLVAAVSPSPEPFVAGGRARCP
jgi:hypothetical protein